jgi:hypothetical protein
MPEVSRQDLNQGHFATRWKGPQTWEPQNIVDKNIPRPALRLNAIRAACDQTVLFDGATHILKASALIGKFTLFRSSTKK